MKAFVLSVAFAIAMPAVAHADEFVDMARATCVALGTNTTDMPTCRSRQEAAARANAQLEERLRASRDRANFTRLQRCARAHRLQRDVYDEVAVQTCYARAAAAPSR